MAMSQKKEYKPKYSTKVETSDFKTDFGTHHMLHFPCNINEDTGFGKVFGMGLSKIRALLRPESIIAMRAHAEKYPEEGLTQIKADDHVGNEWDD
jgi:hypothetical protein